MKPERSFEAERPLANHCPELLREAPPPPDPAIALEQLGEALADTLSASLARLSGGDPAKIIPQPVCACTGEDLSAEMPGLAAHWLFAAGETGAPFLVSIAGDAVLQLVDRTFGGTGTAPDPLPEAFPLSAQLLVSRLEATATAAIRDAATTHSPNAINAVKSDSSLARLAPFTPQTGLLQLKLDVIEGEREPWTITFTFTPDAIHHLHPGDTDNAAAPRPQRIARHPADAPYGDVPLTLSATLVDMTIGFRRLCALRPGDILPVAVARSVPLKADGKTIAHGTIGESDDRIAIQITNAF